MRCSDLFLVLCCEANCATGNVIGAGPRRLEEQRIDDGFHHVETLGRLRHDFGAAKGKRVAESKFRLPVETASLRVTNFECPAIYHTQ